MLMVLVVMMMMKTDGSVMMSAQRIEINQLNDHSHFRKAHITRIMHLFGPRRFHSLHKIMLFHLRVRVIQ